jgi:basic amino acid/polyamine antiporter, APA family
MLTTLCPVTNEAPGLPDAVVTGLAAMLGAGLLVGIAPAASAAGAWLLAGLVLAGLLTVAYGLSTSVKSTPLAVLGRSAGAAAIAGAFGRYLVPEYPIPAALALLAVITALTAAGITPSRTLLRAAVAVVLAVLIVFVVVCFAIAPPPNPAGPNDPAGLPLATAFLVFGFLGTERAPQRHRMITIGLALVIYLAVAGAALHQLGGARLALSPVPLRDALVAADAAGIDRVLTVGAALATVLALFGVLTDVRAETKPVGMALVGLATAVAIVVLTVPALILVAVALMLGDRLLALVTSRRGPG